LPGPSQVLEQPLLSKEFTFAGDFESMPAARDSMMDFVRPHCSDEAEEIDIFLALQEALANAILHGRKGSMAPTLHCQVEIDPLAFTIVVRDPGAGFNEEVVSDSTVSWSNLSEHGRGIRLMRSLMDEVSYRRGGSEVWMRKRRGIPLSKAVASQEGQS
jgi:serine/threonine-protein kinase RsbW